jgi:hypothetical protein
MTTSIRSMPIIAIFVAAAIVPVASAGASPTVDTSSGISSLTALSHDDSATPAGISSLTALSHDDSATPVDKSSGVSSVTAISHDSNPTVTLHRDGSKAVPVVADLDPEPTAAGDGFDWGDAAIGAGAVLFVACLAMLAAAGFSGRRSRTSQPTTAASQSA